MFVSKTPTQWAKETAAPDGQPNHVVCRHKWQRGHFSWQHAAAAVRHGWNDHVLATSEELLLTREDYLAALEAVADPEGVRLHDAAISPWCSATDELARKHGIPERNEAQRKAVLAKAAEMAARTAAETESLRAGGSQA